MNVTTAWIYWRLLLLQMCGVYRVFSHALRTSGSRNEQCECLLALLCWRCRRFKSDLPSVHKYLTHVIRRARKKKKFRTATISFIASVRPSARNNSAPTGRIFIKFNIWGFFENLSRKSKFYWNLTRVTDTLYEELWIFFIISRWILLRMWCFWQNS